MLTDDVAGLDLTHGASVVLLEAEHGELVGVRGLRVALSAIRGEQVASARPRRPDCGVVSVHSPADLLVVDAQGRRAGSDGTSTYQEIPGASYERVGDAKFVTLHVPATYRAVLRGTANGEATVQYREVSAGAVTRHFIYPHVPTRTGSMSEMTVTSGGAVAPSQLRVDLNADGTVDTTIDARSLPGGPPDLEAPRLRLSSPLDGQAVVGSALVDWIAEDSGSGVASSAAVIDGATTPVVIARPGLVAFAPGRHEIALFAEDRAGNGTTRAYSVDALTLEWRPPLETDDERSKDREKEKDRETDRDREKHEDREQDENRAIPVRFVVRRADGTLVADRSVTLELLNSAGQAALPPRLVAADPQDGVAIKNSKYHAILKTRGLPSGQYTLRVSFASPTLTGRVDLPVVLR